MNKTLTCMYTYQKKSVERPVNDFTVNEWERAECKDSTDPITVLWFVRPFLADPNGRVV